MKIINKGNKKAEVLIYEDIGDGWMGGLSAKRFADDLKALGTLTDINIRINSAGGSVFDGVAIYNTLRANGAKITVHVDGLAASIASIIAMAGDEINMAANSLMMIHDPWGVFAGNSTDLRQQADLLDTVQGTLVSTYMTRATVTQAEIEAMMKAETWLTAAEAVDAGLADTVTQEMQIAAHFDLSRFKHPPEAIQAADTVIKDNLDQAGARTALDHMKAHTLSLVKK